MMMRLNIVILLILLGFQSKAHPVHFMVTNISVDSIIHVEMEISINDLVSVLSHNSHSHHAGHSEAHHSHNPTDSLVWKYIVNNFKLESGDNCITMNEYSIKYGKEKCIVTCSTGIVSELKELKIKSTLFLNIFYDYKNLIIVSKGDFEKGIDLKFDKTEETIIFQ